MTREDPRIRTALLSIDPTSACPAWHGAPSAVGLLRGVTVEIALWRPYSMANSVREIALHVAFWETSVANRLTGEALRVGFEQRKTGWPVRVDAVETSEWKDEVRLVRSCHARLVGAVAAFDPQRLDAPLGTRSTRPAIEYIHGVAEHTLYHAAQIKMLKTLAQKATDREKPSS